MPAACIHPPTISCAWRIASDAKGRVMRSASSLQEASSSHRRITVSARAKVTSAELGEADLLRALPQHQVAQLLQVFVAFDDGREVVAGELPHPAREQRRAVRKEDLGLAHAPGIEEQVARRRVAGVVLVTDVEVELAKRDPGRLPAPARLDDLRVQWQHRLELGAALWRELGLEARDETQPRDPDFDRYARDPAAAGAVEVRPTIWKT